MQQVNVIAVVVAALSSFLLGGLWYSKLLFGPAWQRAAGDARKPGEAHPAKVFGLSYLFALAAAFAYARADAARSERIAMRPSRDLRWVRAWSQPASESTTSSRIVARRCG